MLQRLEYMLRFFWATGSKLRGVSVPALNINTRLLRLEVLEEPCVYYIFVNS